MTKSTPRITFRALQLRHIFTEKLYKGPFFQPASLIPYAICSSCLAIPLHEYIRQWKRNGFLQSIWRPLQHTFLRQTFTTSFPELPGPPGG